MPVIQGFLILSDSVSVIRGTGFFRWATGYLPDTNIPVRSKMSVKLIIPQSAI